MLSSFIFIVQVLVLLIHVIKKINLACEAGGSEGWGAKLMSTTTYCSKDSWKEGTSRAVSQVYHFYRSFATDVIAAMLDDH